MNKKEKFFNFMDSVKPEKDSDDEYELVGSAPPPSYEDAIYDYNLKYAKKVWEDLGCDPQSKYAPNIYNKDKDKFQNIMIEINKFLKISHEIPDEKEANFEILSTELKRLTVINSPIPPYKSNNLWDIVTVELREYKPLESEPGGRLEIVLPEPPQASQVVAVCILPNMVFVILST